MENWSGLDSCSGAGMANSETEVTHPLYMGTVLVLSRKCRPACSTFGVMIPLGAGLVYLDNTIIKFPLIILLTLLMPYYIIFGKGT